MRAPRARGDRRRRPMTADWIAADWGTSRLRVWGMSGAAPLWHAASEDGSATLAPDAFAPALEALTAPHAPPRPVLVCGSAGAREGWAPAPYRPVPCPPLPTAGPLTHVRTDRHDACILPGLSQDAPPDVIRSEETQIAGLLAADPDFDGVAVLPGTHTKWARLSAGEVVSFRTAMTGELHAHLSRHSLLRHSLGTWDDAAFAEAVADGLSHPQRLAADLFAIRAADILHGAPHGRSRLSGLLIGAELAAMRPYWLGQRLALIGAQDHAARYAAALAAQGARAEAHDADACTLAGLTAARHLM